MEPKETAETKDATPKEATPVAKEEKPKKKAPSNRMTEEELIDDYPTRRIVPGSLTFLEAENKQAVTITCSTEGCERERLVRTSDLHQIDKCEPCHRKGKRERARERRKAKREAEKAEEAAS